jgi:hypothetical protein
MSAYPFAMEWARSDAALDSGRGISNPIEGYHRAKNVKTGRSGEVVENKRKIKMDCL